MLSLKLHLRGLAALFVLLTFTDATTLTVSTTGGNASCPLLYGLMFEVRFHLVYYLPLLICSRISTTQVKLTYLQSVFPELI